MSLLKRIESARPAGDGAPVGAPLPAPPPGSPPQPGPISLWKGLFLIALTLIVTVGIKEILSIRRQAGVLRETDLDIEQLQSAWQQWRAQTPGTEGIALRSTTSPLGALSAQGYVPDKRTRDRVVNFVESSHPPHGADFRHLLMDPSRYQQFRTEPESAPSSKEVAPPSPSPAPL